MDSIDTKKKYDAFLSHNSADKSGIEKIARLENVGLTPFLDKWHLVPGTPWQEALEEALDKSATCVVFLGPNGLGPWENEEMRSALNDRVNDSSFRVIPVLLPGANPKEPKLLPRFLRRLIWVDFRTGLDSSEALELLIAGIRGTTPTHREAISTLTVSQLERGVIHALPPAPVFIGRQSEIKAIQTFWEKKDESCNILALVGLGGAGKTALVANFLSSVLARELSAPGDMFVWSFYVDQDVNSFLQTAFRHFSNGREIKANGAAMLYRLSEVLSNGKRNLIVLDGLERVQRTRSDFYGAFGELEDPLLRQVVSRLVLGVGQTKCLITSRFPVSDLHSWEGKYYKSIAINQLEKTDARQLLRKHGVKGNDSVLDQIVNEYGAHALTLDHLSTYLAEFCDGDPYQANRLEEPRIDSDIPQERKLARVFYAYEKSLTDEELSLLMRFSIFRFGTTIEALYRIFSQKNTGDINVSGALSRLPKTEFQRIILRLTKLHLILHESADQYTAHPTVRDHFYRLLADSTRVHGAVGNAFKELIAFEVLDEWNKVGVSLVSLNKVAADIEQRAAQFRQLKNKAIEFSAQLRTFSETNRGILNARDQNKIFDCIISLEEENLPELPNLDYLSKKDRSHWNPVKSQYETIQSLSRWNKTDADRDLSNKAMELSLVFKQFIDNNGSKFASGTLSELRNCMYALQAGQISAVPNFRMQYTKLSVRPGVKYVEDPATLDLLEELLYHTIKAGKISDAHGLYRHRLGGRDHLAKQIGEYARGVRILRSFPDCPEILDLAWYLRGVGDLHASLNIFMKVHPIWAGSVVLLQGYLPRIVNERIGWPVIRNAAEFLSGKSHGIIDRDELGWGEAIIGADMYLIKGDVHLARQRCLSEMKLYNVPEMVRGHLILAEIERIKGHLSSAQTELDEVAPWILRSCSVEHLCLLHLVNTRILKDQAQYDKADSECKEGLYLARRCGFGLYHIDFMNEWGHIYYLRAKELKNQGQDLQANSLLKIAEITVLGALNGLLKENEALSLSYDAPLDNLLTVGSRHPECQYIWGSVKSLCLLGDILIEQNCMRKAKEIIEQAIEMQRNIQHPRMSQTQKLLETLSVEHF